LSSVNRKLFWDSQKGCDTQKVARVKGPRKRRVKGQEKGLKRTTAKKVQKSKFWRIRMHPFKIFHIFVPNLGEIYQLGHKWLFQLN